MILGYNVYNEPYIIKTYHNHATQKRNYDNNSNRIGKPWIRLIPALPENSSNFSKRGNHKFSLTILRKSGSTLTDYAITPQNGGQFGIKLPFM